MSVVAVSVSAKLRVRFLCTPAFARTCRRYDFVTYMHKYALLSQDGFLATAVASLCRRSLLPWRVFSPSTRRPVSVLSDAAHDTQQQASTQLQKRKETFAKTHPDYSETTYALSRAVSCLERRRTRRTAGGLDAASESEPCSQKPNNR